MFPRAQKLPQQKPLTKWEKFAKEKGIKKRKKLGMKYDSTMKKYMPRWGSKSKNNFEAAIMEEKVPGKNPFEMERAKKKLTKQKEKLKHLKNLSYREEKMKNK